MVSALRLAPVLAVLALALVSVGCASAPPAPPPPMVAPEEEKEPAPEMGSLEILCNPPTEIAVDGKKIGKTPIKDHKVAPGSHDVTFMDEETGNRTMTVTVGAGEGKTVISDRPPTSSAAKVAAPPAPPAKKK